MTTCRAQSANDGGPSIASQAGLQDTGQFRVPIIDVSLSTLAAARQSKIGELSKITSVSAYDHYKLCRK